MNRRRFVKACGLATGAAIIPLASAATENPKKISQTLDGLNLDGYSTDDKKEMESLHDEDGKIILHPYDIYRLTALNVKEFQEVSWSWRYCKHDWRMHVDRQSDLSEIKQFQGKFRQSTRVAPVAWGKDRKYFDGTN